MMEDFTFEGWRRPDGRLGIRNHCLVLATVVCAAGVVREVGRRLPGAVVVEHPHGCGRVPPDLLLQLKTVAGLVENPNVGGAVLVGLGCEPLSVGLVRSALPANGKPVRGVVIQEAGGSRKAADRAEALAREVMAEMETAPRQAGTAADLLVGLECGGSDTFSGITANPAVGKAVDRLVAMGATAIISETTEMIGALGPLLRRAADEEVADRLREVVGKQEDLTRRLLGAQAHRALAPGNVESGLSTIAEKSLGCIMKGGSSPVREVVAYAERPAKRGLVVMDTPGFDAESVTGMAAAGAQAVFFTTGRGTPAGFPVVPVIKVSSTSELCAAMEDDIDVDAGTVLAGRSLEDVGEELLAALLRAARGERTKAEVNEQGVFAIAQTHAAF